ncbi:DsbA family protein [Anaerolineae bacterium CFX8]|nr:DsbA family protein [Anaerolineae bacterium CFX8]
MENEIKTMQTTDPLADSAPTDGEKARTEPPPVLVIPRVVFNYVVIAITFFILGAVVSAAGSNALFNANSAENRRLIDEAVSAAVAAAGSSSANTASTEPDPNRVYDVSADDDPFIGPADAQVVMIEFSDFNCGYCGRFARETLNPLMEAYKDRVKFVYRDYPILAQSSLDAALAAQCAFEQGNFWDYHNALFNNQGSFGRDLYLQLAQEMAFDVESFTTCLDDQQYLNEIAADFNVARGFGLRGTPSFFINGRFISGAQPYQVFAGMLDEELAKVANPASDTSS